MQGCSISTTNALELLQSCAKPSIWSYTCFWHHWSHKYMYMYLPSDLLYKMHLSRQYNCWLLKCSWSIACRRCSNYIFILNVTLGFNGLGRYNCKTRRESFKVLGLGAPYIRDFTVLTLDIFEGTPNSNTDSRPFLTIGSRNSTTLLTPKRLCPGRLPMGSMASSSSL